MNVHFELYSSKIARTTDTTEIALPEDLTVTFGSPAYDLAELVVNVRNGARSEQRKVKGVPLDLSSFLYAGKIEMTVHMIVKGKPVKEWSCVPLIITEVDKGFLVLDEITDLQKRMANVEKKTSVIM